MKILFGVSGSIASYKSLGIIRSLFRQGHNINVIPTEAALKFVGEAAWQAISANKVHKDVFSSNGYVEHVSLASDADVLVIAPATCDIIAKIAYGLADDLLTITALTARCPVIIAPAMHFQMWDNPITQQNICMLKNRGFEIVGPCIGELTSFDEGMGRLAPDEDIINAINRSQIKKDLAGKKILISLGSTRQRIDPVRYIGNDSSGKQGSALAEECIARGADVTVVAGFHSCDIPSGCEIISAKNTLSMHKAIKALSQESNVVIMSAAIADYKVENPSNIKLSKTQIGDTLNLKLSKNPDILHEISAIPNRKNLIIGFCAETAIGDELIKKAKQKIISKKCDLIVANDVSDGKVFGSDINSIVILNAKGEVLESAEGTKKDISHIVTNLILNYI